MNQPSNVLYFIDDDISFLETFSSILTEEGFRVKKYSDGRIALEDIRKEVTIPVVISDINMPSIGGLSILREIRTINSLIPVIMITGQADSDAFLEAVNNQASYLLMKPFDIDQLLIFVSKAIDRTSLVLENQRLFKDLSEKNTRLKRYSLLFKSIFDSLNLGVVLLDSTWSVLYFNRECENIFDSLEEDILKENLITSNILPSELRDLLKDALNLNSTVIKYNDRNNNNYIVYTLKLDVSSELFYLITFENLTRINNLEAELLKNAEFIQIGKFTAMIAHEIRNPLTGMKTLCNYIERNDSIDKEEINDILVDFNREISRMESLIDKILNVSKNYNDIVSFGKTVIPDKLNEMKRMLSSMAGENITVDFEYDPGIPDPLTANISPDLFDQIVKNVVKNAVESIIDSHAPAGRILIKVGFFSLNSKDFCSIEIIDNGKGFDPFPDFEKETLFTTKKSGIGFGLNICRKILSSISGQIGLSNNDPGATVRLEIPVFNE